LVENPAGSRASISGVNVKKSSALNDNGMITMIGAIRKKKMIPQITRKL